MAVIQFDPLAPVVRGPRAEEDYQVTRTLTQVFEGGSVTDVVQVGDVMFTRTGSTTVIESMDLSVSVGPQAEAPTLSSDTPAICTLVGNSVVPITTGVCTISARTPSGHRRITEFVRREPWQAVLSNPSAPVAGSLRRYLLDQQAAALAGVTPGSDAQRGAVGRNPWQSGGFGGVNPSNFLRAQNKPGFDPFPLDALDQILSSGAQWKAWISPHHFLTWRGHQSSSGPTWVSIAGEIVVEYSASAWSGTLCKLLPVDYLRWLPTVSEVGWYLPVWARLWNTYIGNDGDTAAERGWVQPGNHGASNPLPAEDFRRPYQRVGSGTPAPIINGGDSGSPVFTAINGTLVPVCHIAYQGVFGSLPYHSYRNQIDAAMASLNASGLFTAQTVDLSAFTTY